MARFYKMDPILWDHATVDLTLEEEAAYLRVCNAIYKAEKGCPMNDRVLAGMFRTSTRKARSIVDSLLSKGKLFTRDGQLWNERADFELNSMRVRAEKSNEMPAKGQRNGREPDAKAQRNDGERANKSLKEAELVRAKPPDEPPKTRLEETRRDKEKINNTSLDSEFESLWVDYPRRLQEKGTLTRGAKVQALQAFKALSPEDRAAAIDGLPGFKRMYPDGSKAVVDCVRYFTHKRWLDVEGAAVKPKEGVALPKNSLAPKVSRLVGVVGLAEYRAYFEDGGQCLIEPRGDGAMVRAVNGFAAEQIKKKFFNQLNSVFGFGQWQVQAPQERAA